MKTAVFIYQATQVTKLPDLLTTLKGGEYPVIACGADIEFLLEEKNIPYCSARPLRRVSPSERLIVAKNIGETVLQAEAFSFLSYRGISLSRLLTPSLQYYLSHFLYYLDIVASALEEPYDRVVLYASDVQEILAPGVLDNFHTQSLPDAVRLVCKKRGIRVDTFSAFHYRSHYRDFLNKQIFNLKRALFGYALWALNTYVRIVIPEKKIRILASEYWKNIESFMPKLPEGELALVDRTQVFVMGFDAITRHRAQFVHGDDFVDASTRRRAREESQRFMEQWKQVLHKNTALQEASFRDYSLLPILQKALEHMVVMSEKLVRDIDGTWAMMERLRPDIVLVRASTSAQTHFAVLCEVARLHNIPSIEIQHGVLSVFEGDFTNNPMSEYIAEYGPLERRQWTENNYAKKNKFIDVGSPRFDVYIDQQATREREPDGLFKVVHFAPAFAPGSWNDTYDVVDYYHTMADAARYISNVHVVLKLRPGHADEAFLRETIRRLFAGIPHTIAQFEPLVEILKDSDAVVSYHSTALLEALLSHRPVIYDATIPIYKLLAEADLKPHVAAGALIIAGTQTTLTDTLMRLSRDAHERRELSLRAERFMRENYLFHDGKASERLVACVRSLVQGKARA